MIYFDKPTQKKLVEKFARFLRPGGYLFTGHAENLINIKSSLECIRHSIFQKQ